MTTFTADEFKNARFATHPYGRIAARIDPDDAPWRTSGFPAWLSDEDMARNGWSPLDETRLPVATTDEDARTYALEQIEAAQAETTEAVTRAERAEARAEKAEQELDEAIRAAEGGTP